MAIKHKPRIKFSTQTTGQGAITVGTVVGSSFMSPADAGLVSGDTINYVIEEGNDFEEGSGTIGAGATSFTRDTVFCSKIAGVVGTTKMMLNGNALVRFIFAGEDMLVGPTTAITDGRPVLWDTNNRRLKQHTAALGTAATENVGTSGSNLPKMSAHNTWSAPQGVAETPLSSATAWDGSAVSNLTVNVNGSAFAVANPSVLPSAGEFVAIKVTYSSTHSISFGNKYLGMTGINASNISGKVDHYVFRSDDTNLHLTSFRANITG